MRIRATRWLAFLAIIALGVVGARWLVQEHDAATREAARGSPAASPADASLSPAPEGRPQSTRGDATQGSAPVHGVSAAPSSADLQLDFQLPASTKPGDAFDLNVTINGQVPVQRLTFEIEFDQHLLRPRTLEELEYSNRPSAMRTFALEPIGDGRVSVTLSFGAGTPGWLPSSTAAVAQFEALAPGPAQINIATITPTDRSGRPIAFAVSGRQSHIEIN